MPPADHDHRDVAGGGCCAQPDQEMLRIAIWHEVVGNNDRRILAAGHAIPLRRIAGANRLDAVFLEAAGQECPDILIVIDQQHARARPDLGSRGVRPAMLDLRRQSRVDLRERAFEFTPERGTLMGIERAKAFAALDYLEVATSRHHHHMERFCESGPADGRIPRTRRPPAC